MPESTFRIIAHRGANTEAPENTLTAFRLAFEHGAKWLESDVRETADGHFVILHDEDLRRTSDRHGVAAEINLTEFLSAKAANGESLPTVAQLFESLPDDVQLNLEVKSLHSTKRFLVHLSELCQKHQVSQERLLISSFDHRILAEIRGLDPSLPLGILVHRPLANLSELQQQLSAEALCMNDKFVEAGHIHEAHALGMKMFVFTINDSARAKMLRDIGVDGIFSDEAHRLARQLA